MLCLFCCNWPCHRRVFHHIDKNGINVFFLYYYFGHFVQFLRGFVVIFIFRIHACREFSQRLFRFFKQAQRRRILNVFHLLQIKPDLFYKTLARRFFARRVTVIRVLCH